MQRLWKTAIGKITILGVGGIVGILSLCLACTICGTFSGNNDSKATQPPQKIISFATEVPTPEPTATLKPSPTVKPTETIQPLIDTATPLPTNIPEINKPVLTAGEKNVNLRSGPGTDYNIVGTLLVGQSLEIVGRNPDSSWWQVSAPDGVCWVSASVVTVNNINDEIPVVEAPPLPVESTPTNTPIPVESAPTPTFTPVSVIQPIPTSSDGGSTWCCRKCGANSKACGDSCISLSKTCHKPPGCACD